MPRKNQIKTQRGSHDKAITGFRNISGGHPIELPATKLADSETASRFAPVAVNDWEPENVTGLVDTAKTLRIQNSTGAPRTIVNKAVKHGISTG